MRNMTIPITTIIILALLPLMIKTQCFPGRFDDGSGCQPCPIGYFNINGTGTSCDFCANCTNCDARTGECTNCFKG